MSEQVGQQPSGGVPVRRRQFLGSLSSGLAGIAFASLLQQESLAVAGPAAVEGFRLPHTRPKAKSVIWLFMRGGLSHIESFDPKPMLNDMRARRSMKHP